MDYCIGRGRDGEMAAVVEELYERAVEATRVEKKAIPPVDPNSPDLDDLWAWGEAVAKLGNITPERSKEILAAVRRYAKNRD